MSEIVVKMYLFRTVLDDTFKFRCNLICLSFIITSNLISNLINIEY